MVDHHFDLLGIKHPVFVPCDQIIDGCRGCNFMTENSIEAQYVDIIRGIVDAVRIENFFSNCFTHNVSH